MEDSRIAGTASRRCRCRSREPRRPGASGGDESRRFQAETCHGALRLRRVPALSGCCDASRRCQTATRRCLPFAARSRRGRPGTSASARPLRPLVPAAKPTADQMRVLVILKQLADAADWRGVAAQERAARAVAAAVRTSMPGVAWFVYCTLGIAYHSLGDYSKAIKLSTTRSS